MRILWPVLIGLLAASYIMYRNFDAQAIAGIRWTWHSTFWIAMALVMLGVRDFAYMYRVRVLTDGDLSWRRSFNVIFLWEFASALAPAILGGGFAFAIFIINREKINLGKSITVVLVTSFLDGLFLALSAPIVYLVAGKEKLFSAIDPGSISKITYGQGLLYTFWIAYAVIILYKAIIIYALFFKPRSVKWLLEKLFSTRLLHRWSARAEETGTQLVIASQGLKNKTRGYWLRAGAATFASWSGRLLVANCIIMAFSHVLVNHFVIYSRMTVMLILMLGSPTPGSSGVAELLFPNFLGEFITQGLAEPLTIIWRGLSYYPYLFIGAVLLPRWLKKVFSDKNELT